MKECFSFCKCNRVAVLLAFAVLARMSVFAGVWSWTGAQDSYWTNAANWKIDGAAASVPPGMYCTENGEKAGAFDSAVEFGEVAGGCATIINLDGFWDVSNVVIKASAPRYQFGTSDAQSFTIHSTAGVFRVESGAPAPRIVAKFGAWRYAGVPGGNLGDSFVPKLVNDSAETLELPEMFYVEASAYPGEKAFRFEGCGDVKISGLCTYRSLIYLDLAQTDGAKLIWNCSVRDWNISGIRKIRNASGTVSEIELTENGVLSGYTGMGPFEIAGSLTLSGKGEYVCNVGEKSDANAKDGNKYQDQQNSVGGEMHVQCKVTSVEKGGYYGGWTLYGSGGTTWFDGEIDNQMKGAAKILPSGDWPSTQYNRPTYGVYSIGHLGGGVLGESEMVISGGGRLLYAGNGEICTRPLVITNRVPLYQNKPPNNRLPYAVIEHRGKGKLVFNSEITSIGTYLNGTTVADATLELVNSTEHEAEIGTVLKDNIDAGKLALSKKGSGMWRIAKETLYTGATTISGGALVLGKDGGIGKSSAVQMSGGDLAIESDGGNSRTVSLPAIMVSNGGNRLLIADGVKVNLAGLSLAAGTLDVKLSGSAELNIKGISVLPNGVTIDGDPAEIDENGKFIRRPYVTDKDIAARGGRITDEPVSFGITTPGAVDAGPIKLANGLSSASVKAIVQKSDVPAVVQLSQGQTLSADVLAIENSAASLTIGSEPGTGTLSGQNGIQFDNASENVLSVFADLDVPVGKGMTLSGGGLLRLWWPEDWAGTFNISKGTLALTNDSALAFTTTLTGEGNFRKEGAGRWTLSKAQNSFSGDFTVAGGTVEFSNANQFGNASSGEVIVEKGGALHTSTSRTFPVSKKVRLSGSGPDGTGAFAASSGTVRMYDVDLDGDTSIGCNSDTSATLEITGDSSRNGLDMNGHVLTKNKQAILALSSVKVKNPGSIAFEPYDIKGNSWNAFNLYGACDLGGKDDPPILATVGSRLYLDVTLVPQNRNIKIDIPSSGTISPEMSFSGGMPGRPDGVNTNYANWMGAVEIANEDTMLAFNPWDAENADRYLTISGQISGKGNVNIGYKTKSGAKGHVIFANPSNTYKGGTVLNGVNNASLTLLYPGSIPDWSKLQVYSGGRVGVVAGEGFFSADDVLAAANSGAGWGKETSNECGHSPSTLAVNTSYAPERKFEINLTEDAITRKDGFSLGHDGVGELSVTGSWTTPVNFSCYEGILKYSGAGVKTLGIGLITGNWSLSSGEVLIENAEDVRFTANASVTIGGHNSVIGALGRMTIRNSRVSRLPKDGVWNSDTALDSSLVGYMSSGIVSIEGDSVVTNRHVIGYDALGRGAVYQRAGRVVELGMNVAQKGVQCPIIGNNGYGYYELTGGYYEVFGKQFLGVNPGAQGVFLQKDGCTDRIIPWEPDKDRNWVLANGEGCVAVVQIEGGTFTNRADTVFCVGEDSRAYFTVENGEYICLRPANPNRCKSGGSLTVLNLNGGVFGAWNFARALASYPEGASVRAYCNFNGGTFKAGNSGTAYESLFGTPGGGNWHEAIDRVTVYGRGATICVPSSMSASVHVPLSAPTGMGVASVAWEDTGVKYVGSPVVEIIGDGTGASAFAEFDSEKGKVTGVKVTSPGCDYTWAKAVIRYGNEAVVTNTAVALARFASGSLTKKGSGRLSLNVANTYTGDTVIEEGILEANVAGAIPAGSKIVFKGGTVATGADVALPASIFKFDALGHVTYPGAFEFPAGSGIEIANLDKIEKSAGDYVIATFTGGLSGALPGISNAEGLPEKWGIFKSGNSIKLRYVRGMVLSVR